MTQETGQIQEDKVKVEVNLINRICFNLRETTMKYFPTYDVTEPHVFLTHTVRSISEKRKHQPIIDNTQEWPLYKYALSVYTNSSKYCFENGWFELTCDCHGVKFANRRSFFFLNGCKWCSVFKLPFNPRYLLFIVLFVY